MSPVNPFHPFAPYNSEQLGEPTGREAEVVGARSLLQSSHRLCIISGELGIGKSTFLRHSLSRAMRDEKTDIVILTASPSDTVDSLADSLFSHLGYYDTEAKQEVGEVRESDHVTISQVMAVVKEAPKVPIRSVFELYNRIRKYETSTNRRVILMYDQLEHFLLYTEQDNRLEILQALINLAALPHVASMVVLSVRDKCLHEIFRLTSSYPWITSHILYLHGLREGEVRDYIENSTRQVDIEFGPELVDQVVSRLLDFDNCVSPLVVNAVCYSLASFAIEHHRRAVSSDFASRGDFGGVISKAIVDSLHPLPLELRTDLVYILRVVSNTSQHYGNPSLEEIIKACSGLPKEYVIDGVSLLEARSLVQRDSKKRYRLAHDSMHVGLRYLDKASRLRDVQGLLADYAERWTEKDQLLASHELETVAGFILEVATPLHYLALIAMSSFQTGIQPRSLELERLKNSIAKRDSNVLLSIVCQHVQRHNRISCLRIEEHFLLFMIDTEASIRFALEGLLLDRAYVPSWQFYSILEVVRPRNLFRVISEVSLFLRLPLHIQDSTIKYYNRLNVPLPSDFLRNLWQGSVQAVKPSIVPLLAKSQDEDIQEIVRSAILKKDSFVCLSSLGTVPQLFSEEEAVHLLLDFADSHFTLLVRQSVYALASFNSENAWTAVVRLSKEHSSALVREACIEVLGERRQRNYGGAVADALKDEADFVRESACYAVAKIFSPDDFVHLLLPLLRDASPLVRDAVLHCVPARYFKDDTTYARLSLLRRAAESTQLLLLGTLATSDKQDVDAELEQILASTESDTVAIQSIQIVGERKSRNCIPRLVTLLKSDNEEIVCETLIALQKIGEPQVVRDIIPLLTHHSADVRERVVYLLGDFGNDEAIKGLLALLFDVNDNIKVRAVYALGRHHASDAFNYIQMLSDTPEELRQAKNYYFSRVKRSSSPS